MCTFHLPTQTRVNELHFRTRNLDDAARFYSVILGLTVIERTDSEVLLSANGKGPAMIRFTLDPAAAARRANENGLTHAGIQFPSRADLAFVIRNLVRNEYPFDGGVFQDASESIFVNDPDGNVIEMYHGQPEKVWGTDQSWHNNPVLGLNNLLASIKNEPILKRISPETTIGHLHFNVANFESATRFFHDYLGLEPAMAADGSVSFSADGAHPQIEIDRHKNTIRHAHNSVGLVSYKVAVPCSEVLFALNQRAPIFGYETAPSPESPNLLEIHDPLGFVLEVEAHEKKEDEAPPAEVSSNNKIQFKQRTPVETKNAFSLSTKLGWKDLLSIFA